MATPNSAQKAPASVVIIFGAGGDLTKRKLIPALYNLAERGLLPDRFAMVGVDRSDQTSETYREGLTSEIRDFIGKDFSQELWDQQIGKAYYTT